MKPGGLNGGFQEGWYLEDPDVDSRCLVQVRFRHFPRETPEAMIRKALAGTIPPPVFNKEASLAMSRPNASPKRPDASLCNTWVAKSADISGRIVSAFESFRPPPIGSH
jgi:hypothetical protein